MLGGIPKAVVADVGLFIGWVVKRRRVRDVRQEEHEEERWGREEDRMMKKICAGLMFHESCLYPGNWLRSPGWIALNTMRSATTKIQQNVEKY
jgi:hypothetical protein